MPLSSDVCLPRDHDVRFPSCCLICDGAEPDSTLQLSVPVTGWWSTLCWVPWPRYRVSVPACSSCRQRYLRRQQWTWATAWLFAAGVTWLLLPEVRDMVPRQFQKIVMLMLIGVGLLPLILREVLDPPVINMTAYSDRVEFEFASAEKAMQFSWHNSHAAWIRFNGEELRLPGNWAALMDMLTETSDQDVDEHQ